MSGADASSNPNSDVGTDAGTPDVPDVLRRIVASRKARMAAEPAAPKPAAALSTLTAAPERREPLAVADNRFLGALAAKAARREPAIIAEVKMGSPRIGSLEGRVDPEEQARLYAAGGAAALSVVVEPDHFFGSYDLLARCRRASGLPAVAKDFLVDERQLAWAHDADADAILLIAALHSADELAHWAARARGLGLAPLVETHGAEDLRKLTAAGGAWELVGVNNRDLRTFDVDLAHSVRRLPELPPGALKVAESGIAAGSDVAHLFDAGFDAFLIGESLLLAEDPAAQLADLVSMGAGGASPRGAGR